MKIFNVSYKDRDLLHELYAISGKPHPFYKGLKQGGTGSPRGVLKACPAEVSDMFQLIQSIRYCSIREMQEGILLYFRLRQDTYAIPINRKEILKMDWNKEKLNKNEFILEIHTQQGERYHIRYNRGYFSTISKFLNKIKSVIKD
jgi:hypothetical protein